MPMKIAIVGTGPLAFEAAFFFLNEGADAKLIGKKDPCSKPYFLSQHFGNLKISAEDHTSKYSLENLKIKESSINDYQSLWENYYQPLIEYVAQKNAILDRKIVRIQKRFLNPGEEIPGRSRLHDLFRLVYGLNPSGMVEEQLKENPELEKNIDANISKSLQKEVESFEDFDLVLDCRGPYAEPVPCGPGHDFALNEKVLSDETGYSLGWECLKNLEMARQKKVITIIGTDNLSALTFLSLDKWLEDDSHILNIVTTEKKAFESFLKQEDIPSFFREKVGLLIKKYFHGWKENCIKIEGELKNWRGLPDHERVKHPQPVFPDPKLRLYEGYSVTSLDRLLDREGLYATLEIPAWRDGDKRELVTIASDVIFGLQGAKARKPLIDDAGQPELGYYMLNSGNMMNAPKHGLKELDLVKSEIFKFFSKA